MGLYQPVVHTASPFHQGSDVLSMSSGVPSRGQEDLTEE